jgi:glycosyltransferase involved in cell wall biosynthesis
MMPLHVAFDARHLTGKVLRGMDRYTVGLISQLIDRGIEVTLFHREREPLNLIHIDGLNCRVIALGDRGGLYWEQISVPLAILKYKVDIYHAPAERGVPLFAPCPVVFTIHSLTGDSYDRLVRSGMLSGQVIDYLGYDFDADRHSFWKYLFRLQTIRTNHIITPSEFCRNEVIDFLNVNPKKVTTTYLAAHPQFTRPRHSEAEITTILNRLTIKKPYIIYVGGYERHKNVEGLLETFSIVKKRLPNLMLVTVGTQSIPIQLKQKALSLNLNEHIDILFLVDINDELTDLYDAAELFVSLSWRETFCLPALESLMRGIPAIGSQWGAFPEIIDRAGEVVHPEDWQNAAKAIIQTIERDRTEKEISSQLASERANDFCWNKITEKTLTIYQNLKFK